ncbi:hypothetical protein PPACK8108_LOCUS2837 [Phakopsora pachyrhizi]|uniref:Uncharacterized protein n=1 Tax=Phakopsora pachyrhizi TaxID=170000 RepID=A0AAV0AJV9_PHAPC|nr:hypothetical protein PPACK8108_LOCUS2837 [Phakopsora pachyrhizi]
MASPSDCQSAGQGSFHPSFYPSEPTVQGSDCLLESGHSETWRNKVGDLTKERDRASAKAQKPWGSKNNEMVSIIKEQALKCEEERPWLMGKLVKLTSSNQVLEREVEAEVKYGPFSISFMPLRCNLMTGVDCGWWELQQQITQKDERVKLLLPYLQ